MIDRQTDRWKDRETERQDTEAQRHRDRDTEGEIQTNMTDVQKDPRNTDRHRQR